MYSVYYKVQKKWVRLTSLSYPRTQAVRAFQNTLLTGIEVELRKVRDRDLIADLILVPSYGKKYESEAEVLKDWEANRDFDIRGTVGTKVNKSDAIKHRKHGNGVIVIYGDSLCWIPFPKEG